MRRVTEGATGRACTEPEQQELRSVQREQPRLARAQAAHHRAAVEVALDEAARAERDRHAGEYGGEQRGEAEKTLRTVDGVAHLGPCVLQALQALAAPEALLRPRRERVHVLAFAGREQLVGHAAAGLHQPGGRQVVLVHHQPRREIEKIHAAVGLEREHRRHRELRVAELHALTGHDAERRGQPLVEPHRAACGAARRRSIGLVESGRTAQPAAQRIGVGDRLHPRQLALAIGLRHRGQIDALGARQAAARDFLGELRGQGWSACSDTSPPRSWCASRTIAFQMRSATKVTLVTLATATTSASASTRSSPARQSRPSMRTARRITGVTRRPSRQRIPRGPRPGE